MKIAVIGSGPSGLAAADTLNKAGYRVTVFDDAPKPGEGPSKESREAGHYDVLFLGTTAQGDTLKASVTGDMDPGYGSTSKMLAESAVCLALDPLTTGGGFWTPASALGDAYLKRLQDKGGLSFAVVS